MKPADRSDARQPHWRDWTWQMQQRIRDADGLARFVSPTADEKDAIELLAQRFHFVITPYYASLMRRDDPDCPLRQQVVPRCAEDQDAAGLADPLDEVAHSPVKNVIRVYPDRIAFCVNNECALYCRFCLRKPMVGDLEKLREPVESLRKLAAEAGRPQPEVVALTGLPADPERARERFERLGELGVTHLIAGTRYDTADEFRRQADAIARVTLGSPL